MSFKNTFNRPPSHHEPASPPQIPQNQPLKHPLPSSASSHEAQFEKNYPKNIFIPLIEYLADLGYKQSYQKCVGFKSEVEGKNVVSLGLIYTLVVQDWFVRNINKQLALSHISNKILLNSKIKKKLFHLLIAHLILTHDFIDIRDFKNTISKEANIISKKNYPNDEVFSYPNAIIYLLHLFLKILLFKANKKGYNKLQQQFQKMSIEESPAPDQPKNKNIGSKQEYKYYVKEIVHLFCGKGISGQNYAEILEEVRQTILEKDRVFREKYKLVQGIPNWNHFIECVVIRCFQNKKKDVKITNFIFNQWTSECKNRMISITDSKNSQEPQKEQQKEVKSQDWVNNGLHFHQNWGALPLIQGPESQQPQSQAQGVKTALIKKFSPIILSSNPNL